MLNRTYHEAELTRVVRRVSRADLAAVVRVHEGAFPNGAITRLGADIIHRYYAWQLDGPHDAVAMVATVGGEVRGFCFAGVFRGALSGFLRKHRTALLLRMLQRPWLLASPLVLDRVRTALRVLRRATTRPGARLLRAEHAPSSSPAPQRETEFGILSIAVSPDAAGQGLGSLLMHAAEAEARARGAVRMRLSVSPSNHNAIRFYERHGWSRDPVSGAWQGSMIKELVPGSATVKLPVLSAPTVEGESARIGTA